MSTALPVSGSVDNALLIATAPMPPSPITRAAMRAALPEMARAPASGVCGAAGATAAAAASSSKPASHPRSSTPPAWKPPRSAAVAYMTFATHRTPRAMTTPAAAKGTRVWRSNSTRISHRTPIPPIDQAMLVSSDGTLPPASNSGFRRNSYARAPAVSVTSTVSINSSGSKRRRGAAPTSFVTATRKQT